MKKSALSQDLSLFFDIGLSFARYLGLMKRKDNQFWQYCTHQGVVFNLRRHVADSTVIFENWWLNEYASSLKNVPSDSVIIDIGGHIGTFSIFAATHCPNSKVYVFEPNPANFALLKQNIAINKLEDRIFPFNLAVSSIDNGSIELIFHPDNTGMNSAVFTKNRGEKVVSKTISLETIFSDNNISHCHFLKVDCEGGEYDIIPKSSVKTLQKIDRIIMEYHPGGDINTIIDQLHLSKFITQLSHGLPIPLVRNIISIPILSAHRS